MVQGVTNLIWRYILTEDFPKQLRSKKHPSKTENKHKKVVKVPLRRYGTTPLIK